MQLPRALALLWLLKLTRTQGEKVALTGLQKGTQYNGKNGTIIGEFKVTMRPRSWDDCPAR